MRVLEYSGLDTSRVETAYRRIVAALERDDFPAADVKKLAICIMGNSIEPNWITAIGCCLRWCAMAAKSVRSCSRLLSSTPTIALDSCGVRPLTMTRFPLSRAPPAVEQAETVRYLHAKRCEVLYLDKPLSLDDAQQAIYESPPPFVVIGGAGSGKTALTLEKMKYADGDVFYVTHSAYLAQNARDLYYASGFERNGQDAMFLSYREFLESLRVPVGREASWRDFTAWFARIRQAFRDIDAHQAFEEMRGVIAAEAGGCLTREAYRALGLRQSIFAESERDRRGARALAGFR